MASDSAIDADRLAELYSQLKYVSEMDRHVEKELSEKEHSVLRMDYDFHIEGVHPTSLNAVNEHIVTLNSLKKTLEMYRTLLQKNVDTFSQLSVRPLQLLDLPDGTLIMHTVFIYQSLQYYLLP